MASKKKAAKKSKKRNANEEKAESARSQPARVEAVEGGFPIVGIGASAGGLEAIEGFFSHAQPDCDMAFVVIQHLAPGHKSIMDTLLQKHTEMKVLQIKDGVKVVPNCIYLNQPDKDVALANRRLYLIEPTEVRGARLPIDHFFRSLAGDQEEKAICVVLSGTGTDGTLGLRAVKGAGGMAMVQSESQARYDNMPRSAMDTGLVDYVLPVEKMFDELVKYAKHRYIGKPVEAPAAQGKLTNYIEQIFMLIRSQTGHDFSHYKQNTIRRRIERRMAVHQIANIADYVRFLRQDSREVDTLFKDMLITVTNFFRDSEAFGVLAKTAIPAILKDKALDSTVRVWIPGCATGEEAYSVAMLLAESSAELNVHVNVQIFATDIDQDAIEYARQGIFPDSIAADVSTERLKQFFVKEDSAYRIKKLIREMVVFATQNLIKDPPFSKLDLICCRNVLIYMDGILQKKILPLFHYMLNPGGYLFLGTSETIGDFHDSFAVIDSKWKLFKRRSGALNKEMEHPIMPLLDKSHEARKAEIQIGAERADVRELTENIILQNFSPPCVLINHRNEILYFYGNTEKFLIPPTGEATFDILKMIRVELRYKLSAALHRASKQGGNVEISGLQLKQSGGFIRVNITIRPVTEAVAPEGLILVIFQIKEPSADRAPAERKAKHEESIDARVRTLEQELQSTREYLQTTIEELETSNEELKSTNEELQSTNEELQSTNEELETSREELQSTNEELETVNAELQDKVDQLSHANDDLNNLLASTQLGTIFLDMDLRIKRFTPSVTGLLNVIQSDVGRPISDITSSINYPSLLCDARETLKTLATKEVVVRRDDDRWFSVRVLPYRTVENVIAGVVITFVDITKQAPQAEELKWLASFPEDNPNPVLRVSEGGTVLYANEASQPILVLWGCSQGGRLPGNWRKLISDVLHEGKTCQIEVECEDANYLLAFAPPKDTGFINVYGMDLTRREHLKWTDRQP